MLIHLFCSNQKYDRPENYTSQQKPESSLSDFKSRLNVVVRNRPFVFLMIAFFVNQTATAITQATIIYFFRYYINMEWLFPMVMGGLAAATATGAMIMSLVSRKKGKKKIYQMSNLVFAVLMLVNFAIYWAVGSQETYITGFIVFMMVFILVVAFFNGPITALVWSILPDTVEHGEWKVGIQSEDVLYSVFSFMMKSRTGRWRCAHGFPIGLDQVRSGPGAIRRHPVRISDHALRLPGLVQTGMGGSGIAPSIIRASTLNDTVRQLY